MSDVDKIIEKCESPIEVKLGEALQFVIEANFPPVKLIPQFKLERYRYDFAISIGETAILLIECDGREFHSTAEQIERDILKERTARKHGMVCIRYHGSDIWRNPYLMAEEIIRVVQSVYPHPLRKS